MVPIIKVGLKDIVCSSITVTKLPKTNFTLSTYEARLQDHAGALQKAAHRGSEEEKKARKNYKYNISELRRFENNAFLAIVKQRQPAGDQANVRPGGSKLSGDKVLMLLTEYLLSHN
jgi:hypothetical protein